MACALQKLTTLEQKMRLIVVTCILIVTQFLFADDTVQKLVNLPHRPTVAEIQKAFAAGMPPENPFHGQHNAATQNFEGALADIIAEFELAFPGATYAPVGRDVVMIGDMMDAFYTSIGLPGRIKRINASGRTLEPATDAEVLALLKGSGLDLENIERSPGFILFDDSWYRSTSQMTRLIRIGYDAYKQSGKNPQSIIEKFNAINAYEDGGMPIKTDNRESMVKAMSEDAAKYGYPLKIFALSKNPENGIFLYNTEWHDRFLNIEMRPDGIAVARLPEPNRPEMREQVLFELYEIMKRVATPEFRALVEKKAESKGYKLDFSEMMCTRALQAI